MPDYSVIPRRYQPATPEPNISTSPNKTNHARRLCIIPSLDEEARPCLLSRIGDALDCRCVPRLPTRRRRHALAVERLRDPVATHVRRFELAHRERDRFEALVACALTNERRSLVHREDFASSSQRLRMWAFQGETSFRVGVSAATRGAAGRYPESRGGQLLDRQPFYYPIPTTRFGPHRATRCALGRSAQPHPQLQIRVLREPCELLDAASAPTRLSAITMPLACSITARDRIASAMSRASLAVEPVTPTVPVATPRASAQTAPLADPLPEDSFTGARSRRSPSPPSAKKPTTSKTSKLASARQRRKSSTPTPILRSPHGGVRGNPSSRESPPG
jgi:hypothetical protein